MELRQDRIGGLPVGLAELFSPKAILSSMPLVVFLFAIFFCAFNPNEIRYCLFYLSYYILFLMVLGAFAIAIHLADHHRATFFALLKSQRVALAVALIATAVVFLSVPSQYRVLSDETDLIGVSRAMTKHHAAYLALMELWNVNHYVPVAQALAVPKRPFLFPFFIHLAHLFTGYRPENAFLVNALAFFALMLMVFSACAKRLGFLCGVAAVLLVMSQPVLNLVATSAEFELFSFTFVAALFLAFHHYLSRPSSDRLLLLWIIAVLAIHTRYECFAYVAIILTALILSRELPLKFVRERFYLYAWTPVCLLPFLWQRWLEKDIAFVHQAVPGFPKKFAVFSASNAWKHMVEVIHPQIPNASATPYPLWVLAACFVFLLLIFVALSKREVRWERYERIFFLTLGFSLFLNGAIFLSHSAGSLFRPTASRYFLGFCVAFSLVPFFYKRFVRDIPSRWLFIGSLGAFLFYHPIAMQNTFLKELTAPVELRTINGFLRGTDKKHTLLITEMPNQFTIDDYSAINFGMANQNIPWIQSFKDSFRFTKVIVVQRIFYASGKPAPLDELSSALKLRTLQEMQIDHDEYLRFSEVVL